MQWSSRGERQRCRRFLEALQRTERRVKRKKQEKNGTITEFNRKRLGQVS